MFSRSNLKRFDAMKFAKKHFNFILIGIEMDVYGCSIECDLQVF